MDTIKYLLSAVIKLVIFLLLGALALWLVGLLFPAFNFKNIHSVTLFSGDWLPAPKQYHFAGSNVNSDGSYGTEFRPAPEYDGYSNQNTATNYQNSQSNTQQSNTVQSQYTERSLYIRNLSVYEGGKVSYGDTILGEARSDMFRNGIFTVLLVDTQGRTLDAATAINTGTWSIPGWTRFQFTVGHRLPANQQCALVFISSTTSARVYIPVVCR